ncbi:MAG: hypothetical protein HKM06_08260 [Spirochaetales bacterium]|nr:hypothetical protein [Spirochaetales bacterium]
MKTFLLSVLLLAGAQSWAGAQPVLVLADGFDTIHLGMTLPELEKALGKSGYFLWRGLPDVSLLSKPNDSLIDVRGIDYFTRAVLQLRKGQLYVASFDLNPRQFDYYGVYTALVKKYGPPKSLDPSLALWEDKKTRLTLEKPLTVKYLDLALQKEIDQSSQAGKAYQEISREKFLELF